MDRRTLLTHAAAAGLVAPLVRAVPALAAPGINGPTREQILSTVDPELRDIANKIMDSIGSTPFTRETLKGLRAGAGEWTVKPSPDIPFERRVIPVGGGNPDVAIFIVNARPGGEQGPARPAILHTHGGGFVTGSAEISIASLQDLCRALDCVAVSVEYRLAPETTFAGSIEDNYAGLKWLHANAGSLGVDPARIALLGESAGGGHAALLAITARDRGEVPVCFQCLVYPMLDDRTGATGPAGRAVPWHVGNILWTPERNRFGWECFLGVKPGGRKVPGGVPARVRDLAGLPPTFIGVGTVDLFVDEDIDYAQRLGAAGVPVELIVVPGGFHGFDNPVFPADVTRRFNDDKLTALKRAFKPKS